MNSNKCIGCDKDVSNPFTVCEKCSNNSDTRRRLDIRVSADYMLGDDPVINGLCFLHACGVLDDFIDRSYSAKSAFLDSAEPLNSVNENCVDYDAEIIYNESRWIAYPKMKPFSFYK